MQITIQLSDEYAKKLTYIQQQTDQDLIDTIKSSIDLHYQHLQQVDDPLVKLKQGGFIGCFRAEPDLAANSEVILRSMIQEKHDHC